MSDGDTIGDIAREIGAAFTPLSGALRSPGNFEAFMRDLGWDITAIPDALAGTTGPLATLGHVLSGGTIAPEDTPKLIDAIRALVDGVQSVDSQPSTVFPPGLPVAQFKSEFPRQVVDYLLVTYLLGRLPEWGTLLKLIGVIRLEPVAAAAPRLSYIKRTVAWEDLANFFSDPAAVLVNAYNWGDSAFRDQYLILNVAEALRAWGLRARLELVAPQVQTYLTNGAIAPGAVWPAALKAPLVQGNFEGARFEISLGMMILPETATDKPGVALLPFAEGTALEEIPLTDFLSLVISGGFDFAGGIALLVRPNKPPEVMVNIIPAAGQPPTPASAELGLGLKVHPTPGASEVVILGNPTASRLRMQSASLTFGARIDTSGKKDIYVECALTGAGLVIKAAEGDADSFLAKLMPKEGFAVNFDLTVGFSTSQGVYFAGSGGLQIDLPAHIHLGPIEIVSATLAVKPKDGKIPIELGATIKGELGPIKAVVENLGLRVPLSFPADHKGNLGPIQAGFEFKPPNGVGMSVNTGVVIGGGYLFIDADRGEYAGALELTIASFISIKAIGLITTRLPDGSPGFSLLLILTAEFGSGLNLGYGFVLIGVGGLIGLNRMMKLQPLMEGVRTGAIQGIMFPKDVVANAPKILSDLRTIFPMKQGTFLIGPMLKIGWGAGLISLALGVIIEIPGNVAIIGVLRAAIPPQSEDTVLVLQVSFAGAIEFDKKRAYFFASLFESRLLFMPLSGDMGVLIAVGDDANFVISVGGFHPQFQPPPLPFPRPDRIGITVLDETMARIRASTYFAITTNSAQMGVAAELYFGFSVLGLQAQIGFDVLVIFSPFHFVAEASATASLTVFGAGIFNAKLTFLFEGPTPWHAKGFASIQLLFWEVKADFDTTWGETARQVPTPIEVLKLIADELAKLESWRAVPPVSVQLFVTVRKLDEATNPLVLHPLGFLRITQKGAPLEIAVDKVGTQVPSDGHRFTVSATGAAMTKRADATEQFAIGQYQEMTDAQKMSRPAFQPQTAGFDLAPAAAGFWSPKVVRRVVRYEEVIVDTNYRRLTRRFMMIASALFHHFLKGSSATKSEVSAKRRTEKRLDGEKVRVEREGYAVAFSDTNAPMNAASLFASEAQARQAMYDRVASDPSLADRVHVLPAFELSRAA